MSETRASLQQLRTCLGFCCLVAIFLLWSPGVQTVRAGDDPSPASPSPESDPQKEKPLAVVPARSDADIEMAPRDPDPRAESVSEVIVLNTRGYNYGPDRPTSRPRAVHLPAAPAAEAQ